MATSPLKGRLERGAVAALSSYQPISAESALNYRLNNLLHYADEYAQVRVNWMAPATAWSGGQGYITGRTSSLTTGTYYPITSFGPFAITLRERDGSYRLRVRLAGASSAGNEVQFRAVLCPQRDAGILVNELATDFMFETGQVTSTSAAWLTGASLGDNAWETMVWIPPDWTAAWMTETSTLSDVGGDRVTVEQCLVSLNVFGRAVNAGSVPRLFGAYAAEYVGT